jgi:hypothetical protein
MLDGWALSDLQLEPGSAEKIARQQSTNRGIEMLERPRPRLTYANVIATLALFLALGGGAAYAASLGKNSVGAKQLKKNAVTGAKVKDGSLSAGDFKAGQLPAGERGPQGVPGAPGASGATNVVVRYGDRVGVKEAGEVGQALATCAPGEALTGGGFDLAEEPETATPVSPYTLIVNRPGGEGEETDEGFVYPAPVNGAPANSWTVVLRNELEDPTIFFRAYAMCAKP